MARLTPQEQAAMEEELRGIVDGAVARAVEAAMRHMRRATGATPAPAPTPEPESPMAIPVEIGTADDGQPLVKDLVKMPHCLIAGADAGERVGLLSSLILSALRNRRPDEVKLILFAHWESPLGVYGKMPHLMCPIVSEPERAVRVLNWAVEKMKERYDLLSEAKVRNIADYNKLTKGELRTLFQPATKEEWARIPKRMPYIIIVVSELADLMAVSRSRTETSIVRLAQLARTVGIHLVVATQHPKATVITALVRANMTCKIAMRVAQKLDSRIVLDTSGAEALTGKGNMLFLWPGAKPIPVLGKLTDDREAWAVVKHLGEQAEPQFDPELFQPCEDDSDTETEQDALLDEAARIVLAAGRGHTNFLQRRLSIGYARASRLMDALTACGVLGEYRGSQARDAIMTLEEWEALTAPATGTTEDPHSKRAPTPRARSGKTRKRRAD